MSATAENIETELRPVHGKDRPVVIVGTGPVGMRVVRELLRRNPNQAIVLYGGEPWEPYNRVRLSSVLAGEASIDDIQNPLSVVEAPNVVQHHNCPVVRIDTGQRLVVDALGRSQPYADLVLATGSTPHIPAIPGLELPGVFTFRDLSDTERLIARRASSRRIVVLGGGLLGLEAARGLRASGTEVTVVDHAATLMSRQLDEAAAELLREHVLGLGIRVWLNDGVSEVIGDDKVEGVRLCRGKEVACDTLVIATGIKPNVQLAVDSGIGVGRGIRVDDQMRTSVAHVFAIGECAEHRGEVYGLVGPGLEQAGVAAHTIIGGASRYRGSLAATKLKVVGAPVFSMGRTGIDESVSLLRKECFREVSGTAYRKILVERGRLAGAVAVGGWPEMSRVQESINKRRRVWPWQLRRFRTTGCLWAERDAEQVALWPAGTTVCQCAGVTRGTLTRAIDGGCGDIGSLARATGASTVCGSCKPLLGELLGGSLRPAPETGSTALIWAAALSMILAVAFLVAPNIPYPDSVRAAPRWDVLWRDGLFKQISGFTLLGTGALISLISFRKRSGNFSVGRFPSWRVMHVIAGTLVAATLVIHTGFRLGYNLNLLLMLTFVAIILVGAVASGIIGLQHVLPGRLAQRTREISLQLHLWLLWPLPALLGFHIAKTYWF